MFTANNFFRQLHYHLKFIDFPFTIIAPFVCVIVMYLICFFAALFLFIFILAII